MKSSFHHLVLTQIIFVLQKKIDLKNVNVAKVYFHSTVRTIYLKNASKFWKQIKSLSYSSPISTLSKHILNNSVEIKDKADMLSIFMDILYQLLMFLMQM